MRARLAKALLGRMEAGGGVDVAGVVVGVAMGARLRRSRRFKRRRFCRKSRLRLSSRGGMIVRVRSVLGKTVGRETIVEIVAEEIVTVEIVVDVTVGGTTRVRAVDALKVNLRAPSLRLSRLFCRVSRFRSIGGEKMVRRKLRLPKLRRPM